MKLKKSKLKEFLDEKVELYNRPSFIKFDPISIPHRYSKREDIEISGFLAATIAWGNRRMILKNADRMMALLDDSPYDFIMNSDDQDSERIEGFVHRTFNSDDLIYFIKALRHIYLKKGGLESIFNYHRTGDSLQPAIHELKKNFFELPHSRRTERQIPDPDKGSAAKKINICSFGGWSGETTGVWILDSGQELTRPGSRFPWMYIPEIQPENWAC
jgi:uncharacterized protein (TIGR02757 family)